MWVFFVTEIREIAYTGTVVPLKYNKVFPNNYITVILGKCVGAIKPSFWPNTAFWKENNTSKKTLYIF
jgi:hypothetical protein